VNIPIELQFDEETLVTKDENYESVMKFSEVIRLVELPTIYLLQLNAGASVVIPKRNFAESEKLKSELGAMNIPFVNELDWKFS
jgi:hypothetical protein